MQSFSPDEILWIIRGTLLLLWLGAFTILACQFAHVCAHPPLADKDAPATTCGTRCNAWADALNRKSTIGISLRLVMLIAPPAFYLQILMPCWECFDFEAAATHEVGHGKPPCHVTSSPCQSRRPRASSHRSHACAHACACGASSPSVVFGGLWWPPWALASSPRPLPPRQRRRVPLHGLSGMRGHPGR